MISVQQSGRRISDRKKVLAVIALGLVLWTPLTLSAYQLAAGEFQTIGVTVDGKAVIAGSTGNYWHIWLDFGTPDVSAWTEISEVAAGAFHVVGLKTDGSAVSVTTNDSYQQSDVAGWSDVVKVAAGRWHTAGLRSDGTVLAVGPEKTDSQYNQGQTAVAGWKNMIDLATGPFHTVGVNADGTVQVAGTRGYIYVTAFGNSFFTEAGSIDLSGWTDIQQVATGPYHTVGLKTDGTVVAEGTFGYTEHGELDVAGWQDIRQVAAGPSYTFGLKTDGTVMVAGPASDMKDAVAQWSDIIQVAAGNGHTAGLKSDGTVVAAGSDTLGQTDVSGWVLSTGNSPAIPQEIPVLSVAVDGIHVTLSWSAVAAANKYALVYRDKNDPNSVWQAVELGNITWFLVDLWTGAAFDVAIHAGSEAGYGDPSNIETVVITGSAPAILDRSTRSGINVDVSAIPFDAAFCLGVNPNLVAVGFTVATALNHWESNGIFEGRQGSPDFNVTYYLQVNPDL